VSDDDDVVNEHTPAGRIRSSSPARIYVVGTSGSGKTVLAEKLADQLGLEHVQLDALYWGPGWSESDRASFAERARAVTAQPSWVIDGAHRAAIAASWDRAEWVIWLDYPLRTILRRLVRRTARRVIRQEPLHHDNVERYRRALGRRSPIVWAIRTHDDLRREIEGRFERETERVLVRLRSPRETDQWLRSLAGMPSVSNPPSSEAGEDLLAIEGP
jgi:adenylate kinase family enzyme